MTEPVLSDAVKQWLVGRRQIVLVTIRADGSPQTSNVSTGFDGTAFQVSITETRAKTRNLRRDPRAVVHVLGDDFWTYASIAARAELSPLTSAPGDATGQALLELYNRVSPKPHPDPDDFFRAMVADQRLVLTLTPTSITAMGVPS